MGFLIQRLKRRYPMKKLIALMLVFFFFFGCATTIIKSKPSGAEIYKGEELQGKTPYRFSSGAIAGTKWDFTLKREGYNDNPVQIKKNHADIGVILVGLFLFWPLLLWWGDFPDEYNFEMEKLESKPTSISTEPQVTSPAKPITSTPVTRSMGTEKIVTVTWTFANIRSGAGNDYSVVTSVKQGDKLIVIGELGDWFNVRLEGGQQGWISNKVVKPLERGIPEGLEEIQSTWTEQEKYAFNFGRAASLGAVSAAISKVTGQEMESRATRQRTEEEFIAYKDFPDKLEGLHQVFEWTYNDFLNPNKARMRKNLEVIISNLSGFLYDLGWAYNTGVLNAFLNKIPETPRAERDKRYPFVDYKNDPKALEQLHRAYEWGYIHGKARLLHQKD
jgi:SH3-like domain-containing protein